MLEWLIALFPIVYSYKLDKKGVELTVFFLLF